jgi:hypothetical protein
MTIVINTSLLAAVESVKPATFAHIEYESTEKLPKYLGLGIVTKRTSGNVQLRYNYENAVNNRLEKAGLERTFEAQSLPWGQWFIPNLIITHKDETYLRFYSFKGAEMNVTYFVDGHEATPEELAIIKDYKKAHAKESNAQSAAGLEENQVKPCNVNTKNIIAFSCGQYKYERQEHEQLAEVTR